MSKVRIGINGMGRIGRTILKSWLQRNDSEVEIVAVNDLADAKFCAYQLKYDSVTGVLNAEIKQEGDSLIANGHSIKYFSQRDPAEIPWSDCNVDIVFDSTGIFSDKASLGKHLGGTVKKVIMCAPGKDLDGTFVMGVNHENYNPAKHNIISNASCTTNCLAPVAKVLNDTFGIESGLMTTIHAYTGDQNLLDGPHRDYRRSRAAALSMVPTTTGAAKAVGEVLPELKGKLDGFAIRVPTPNVSVVDLSVNLKKEATKESVNAALKEAANGPLKGILSFEELPLVSIDFCGRSESSMFDSTLTNAMGKFVKVISWYDNEMGYSNRVIDLAKYIATKF